METKPTVAEALQEIQDLLRTVSSLQPPHRSSAVRYTQCRAALLESQLRSVLPGFLVQCVSIFKFHDFISLYHPKQEARVAFVDESFAACRERIGAPPVARRVQEPVYDIFDSDPETPSSRYQP